MVDPSYIAEFVRCRFFIEHAKVAIEYSSYIVATRTVSLHHSSGIDLDNNMKDMAEDWIDMSILENTTTLDIRNMDSGVLFDHDNDKNSMSSVNTFAFAQCNMPGRAVQGFEEAASAIRGTSQNETDDAATPIGVLAAPESNSAEGTST